MKKFAFLMHLRNSCRKDLPRLATPLGWIPDSLARFALRNRPLPPFIWSEVTVTPGATEPEGYIIMLPYSGRQLLEQKNLMLQRIEEAMKLAASKGAEIMGLGAFPSLATLGGALIMANRHVSITNGNAYAAVITWQKIAYWLECCTNPEPVIALVGATGSVGTLVSSLLATHNAGAKYLLVARNQRRLAHLATHMWAANPQVQTAVSTNMDDVKGADIVALLNSDADYLLQSHHLKEGSVVLDNTQPRSTHPDFLKKRPDVTIIDGGLVAIPTLRFIQRGIGLPQGTSFASLAETILLAESNYEGDFSIGTPTFEQAEFISTLANHFSHLGFGMAPDHSFGKPLTKEPIGVYKTDLRQLSPIVFLNVL